MKGSCNEAKDPKEDEVVIWEDGPETKKCRNMKSLLLEDNFNENNLENLDNFDQLDNIGFLNLKKGNKLMRSIFIKIRKNLYLMSSLLLMISIYYMIIFECLMPMYESQLLIVENKKVPNFKNSNQTSQNSQNSIINNSINNQGAKYIFYFHIIFFLFLFSFMRSSAMNPGKYEKEYTEVYSLQKYHELYSKFYLKLIFSKKKSNQLNQFEFPTMNFRSNDILQTKLSTKHEDSDKDSIMVDADEKFVQINRKLKNFEKDLHTLRTGVKYKEYWKMNCFNFRKRSLRENLCRFCTVIKPERAYHCKQCRVCVKKMDHHCFFINNCIGYSSYKIFFNMLLFTVLVCWFSAFIMIKCTTFVMDEYSLCFFTGLFFILLFGVCLVGSLVLYFMIYHFSLILKGITQIEDTFRYDQRYEDYYCFLNSMTKWKRFIIVFGANPLIWILPLKASVTESKHGGYEFREIG